MKTVLCYGDSNTWGYIPKPASDQGAAERYDRVTRWTGVLREHLDDVEVIEEGLNGRSTTQPDFIEGEHKNGLTYLKPCLESHAPLDLVVLMLGTNDTKARFGVPASDIALGVTRLAELVLSSQAGRHQTPPKLLILAPPPLGKLGEDDAMFSGGKAKSRRFAKHYRAVASDLGCAFFEVGSVVTTSDIDGVHWSAEGHRALGEALAPVVQKVLDDQS